MLYARTKWWTLSLSREQEELELPNEVLRLEKQRLEVENAKLREANPEGTAQIDAEVDAAQCRADNEQLMREAAQLRALYEHLLRDMQEGQEKVAKKVEEVAER